MSTNPDSVGAGSGEFKPRVEPSEPMTTKGHAPGVLVGNDKVPEFQAETLPAGTAPPEKTFQPQNDPEVPPVGMDKGDEMDATDIVGGATSADVHTGLGHPGSGMSSKEIRNDGEQKNKNPGRSLEGVGAGAQEFKTADETS